MLMLSESEAGGRGVVAGQTGDADDTSAPAHRSRRLRSFWSRKSSAAMEKHGFCDRRVPAQVPRLRVPHLRAQHAIRTVHEHLFDRNDHGESGWARACGKRGSPRNEGGATRRLCADRLIAAPERPLPSCSDYRLNGYVGRTADASRNRSALFRLSTRASAETSRASSRSTG